MYRWSGHWVSFCLSQLMSLGTGRPYARSHWLSEHICFARSLYCENVLRKSNSKSEWGWEESLGENGYIYMCGWVPLLSTVTLLISYCVVLVAPLCPTLCNSMDYSPPSSTVYGILHARLGCHLLLQGIFPTQGSNPGLLRCRQILYCLSHLEFQSAVL